MNNEKTGADHAYGFGTRAIHAGAVPDPVTGARATPIHQTTSFVFDSAEHAASRFNLQTFGNVYSRISNPTVAVLEERIASLEGGRAALACATGMAAQMTALLAILKAGDHIVPHQRSMAAASASLASASRGSGSKPASWIRKTRTISAAQSARPRAHSTANQSAIRW